MTLLQPGASVGPYEILDVLGSGALGTVYRARQVSLDRQVAIKVLAAALSVDPDLVERFRREARTAASLRHPHIVTVFDTGEDRGRHYIAMELLGGHTLNHLPLPLDSSQAIGVILPLCEALAYAHQSGVVHRDLKPENILIDSASFVTLTDFSIARVAGQASLTLGGGPLGTPEFMSPEQAHGENVDARSDVYSLGLLLYFLLTGESPFKAENALSTIYRQIHEPLPSLPANVPAAIAEWVGHCCQKAAADRYGDCAEALIALNKACSAKGAPPGPAVLSGAYSAHSVVPGDDVPVPAPVTEQGPAGALAPVGGLAPTSGLASASGLAPTDVERLTPVSAASPTFVRHPVPVGSHSLAHPASRASDGWSFPAWSALLVAATCMTPLALQGAAVPLPFVFWLLTLGMAVRCWRSAPGMRRLPLLLTVLGILFGALSVASRWNGQGWYILLFLNAAVGGIAGVYSVGAAVRQRKRIARRAYVVLEGPASGEAALPAALRERLLDEMSAVARRLRFGRRQMGLRATLTREGARVALEVHVFDREAALAVADTWVQGDELDAAELAGDAARQIYLKLRPGSMLTSGKSRARSIRALPGAASRSDVTPTIHQVGRRRGD